MELVDGEVAARLDHHWQRVVKEAGVGMGALSFLLEAGHCLVAVEARFDTLLDLRVPNLLLVLDDVFDLLDDAGESPGRELAGHFLILLL